MANRANKLVSNESKELLNNAIPANNRAQLGTKLNGVISGQHTMATTSEAITITGVLATDIAVVTVQSDDTGGAMGLLTATCSADTLTITAAASTNNDGVVNYIIMPCPA